MGAPLRIVIVDDTAGDVASIVRELRCGGLNLVHRQVSTCEELGVALAREDWDAVIAEYALSGCSSVQVLGSLRKRDLDVPVIIVSDVSGDGPVVEAIKAGACDFVRKRNLKRLVPILKRELKHAQARQARERAEAALGESQAWYKSLVETSPDAIIVTDLDGQLFMANQRAVELRGCDGVDDLLGKQVFEFLLPMDRHRALKDARRIAEVGRIRDLEYTMLRDDETQLSVELSASVIPGPDGEPTCFVGVLRDITKRVKAQDELRQRNRELDLLYRMGRALNVILDQDQLLLTILSEVKRVLNVAATSLWLVDPETEEVVCQEATGPQRESVRGWRLAPGEGIAGWVVRHGESVIVPDTRADPRHFKGVDQQIGLGARSILSVPLRARQDVIGALQVIDTQVGRFSSSDLTLTEPLAATAAIAIENTRLFAEEEQRAAELASALEQQRELDRLKDQFIQNVSHELRTPLGLIQAYAQLLVNGELGDLQPNQHEPVAVIARRTQMLAKIVEDLTAILETETQKTHYVPVDMAELVQQLLVDFKISVENAGLHLVVHVESDLPLVLGDATHLNQVLDNLLGNALKFTPPGGSIQVSLVRERSELVLYVSDSGVGIPSDELERVFERFYQVDGSMSRRFGGAGLGLALVKEVVQAHGGQVSVASQLERGSTFKVRLPVWS
jgi:PAS domain S-box-containing protein